MFLNKFFCESVNIFNQFRSNFQTEELKIMSVERFIEISDSEDETGTERRATPFPRGNSEMDFDDRIRELNFQLETCVNQHLRFTIGLLARLRLMKRVYEETSKYYIIRMWV